MDLTFNDAQLAFRDELRSWLREHGPGGALGPEPDDEDVEIAVLASHAFLLTTDTTGRG